MPDKRLLRHPGIQLLQRCVEREQRMQLIAFSLMLLAGLVCCLFAFHDNALLTIAGLTFTVLGITALFHIYQNWNDDRLMRILRHQPKKIVWVYSVVIQRSPFGVHLFQNCTLFFKLVDGDEISVMIPPNKQKLATHTLNRLLPHASFGYSPERAEQYQKNPKELLRKPN